MTTEKKMQIVRVASAKRELERQQMTIKANNFSPAAPLRSDEKPLSNGEMRILIGALNRIAVEIQNMSRLLARSVES